MKKYRRIEISAYRRQVTIVSGEWSRDEFQPQPEQNADGISLRDHDSIEPIGPDSPAGQLIIAEAMRTLEKRLLPGGGQPGFMEDRSVYQTGPIGPINKMLSMLRYLRQWTHCPARKRH